MKSLNVNVLLPDTIRSAIIDRAKSEGVDPAHYCSSLIIESLSGSIVKIPNGSTFMKPASPPNEIDETNFSLPDTLEQIFAVCRCVWREKMDFPEAIHKVAKNFKVNDTTVRDKCTRRISLPHSPIDTEKFLAMLAQPSTLRDYLCHRFPKHSNEIMQCFQQILP